MAVVLGTNAGFVTVAPTSNPVDTNLAQDGACRATKHTCPADVDVVTEVGFWIDSGSTGAAYSVALYSHDSGSNTANALLYSSTGHTTSVGSGNWETVTGLSWSVTPGAVYWICVIMENRTPNVNTDYCTTGGRTGIRVGLHLSLPDPFASVSDTDYIMAFYAKVESSVTYSELSGTIAGQSSASGDLTTTQMTELSGTIAGQSSASANLGFVQVALSIVTKSIQRLVGIGNNKFYYEDI